MHVDRVIVTDLSFWRLVGLVRHRKRRIRKKYARVLFIAKEWTEASRDEFIEHLRAVHRNGRSFSDKGARSAVRAMRKAGHHDVRASRR